MTEFHRQIEHALTNVKLAIDESLAGEDAAILEAIDEVRALTVRAIDTMIAETRDRLSTEDITLRLLALRQEMDRWSHAALTGSQSNTSFIVEARPLPSPERCEQTGQGCLSNASKSHFHRRCKLEDG
jgi:hypothetical protein